MYNIQNQQSGQGLIELIVGIALVSVALISAVILTTRSIQNTDVTRKQQQALRIAKKSSETVRKMRTDLLWNEFTSADFSQTLNNIAPYKVLLPDGFTRSVDISDISAGKTVTVFIMWSDVKGDHAVDLATNYYN